MTIELRLGIKPIAKKRPRFARIGKFVRTYKDPSEQTEEGKVYLEIRNQYSGKPLLGALELQASFRIPRPASHFGSGKNADRLKDSAPKYPTGKPDTDNYLKFIMDCMNGHIWVDDSQVVRFKDVDKAYLSHKGAGEIIVKISELN